jgi:hypothetical protein
LKKERPWRTREDPFSEVWDAVSSRQIEESPGLEAKTVFEFLQRQNPRSLSGRAGAHVATAGEGVACDRGSGQGGVLRTEHPPGRLGASDFTHMEELGVTIQGQSFPHLIYHFVLTYSNWEAATVCFSESFESLSEGLQNALWELGKVPHGIAPTGFRRRSTT